MYQQTNLDIAWSVLVALHPIIIIVVWAFGAAFLVGRLVRNGKNLQIKSVFYCVYWPVFPIVLPLVELGVGVYKLGTGAISFKTVMIWGFWMFLLVSLFALSVLVGSL